MTWSRAQVTAVVAALLAATVSYHLLGKHVRQTPGPSWFAAGCSDSPEPGGANCAAVLQSPWSYWPPKLPDRPSPKGHVPVAFLGLAYYAVLAVWFAGIGVPSRGRRWLHLIPLLVIAGGLAASGMFLYIMFAKLEQWCPWCVATHALNGVIAVCAVLMWPRKRVEEEGAVDAAAVHPSGRLAVMTVTGCILALYGLNKMQVQMQDRRVLELTDAVLKKYIETYQTLTADGRVFLFYWQQSVKTPIDLHVDDPVRAWTDDPENVLHVVVFSDFGCPMCRKVAERIEREVQPLFAGNIAVWFKHYPLDTTCNPMTSELKHPFACDAARMAEAARVLAGNVGFWMAHDFLFAHQEEIRLGKITPERVAGHVGVDAAALRTTMMSEAVSQRLVDDAQLARRVGLPGTPGVYIHERRIENFALENLRFWDLMAEFYWQARKVERPAETRLSVRAATPGNPGSAGVP